MFEQWEDLPAWVEHASTSDEPDPTEADYRRLAAEQIEAASTATDLTVTEVIARGETEAVTPALYAALDAIDVSTLGEDEVLGYAVAMDRVANAAHARRGLGVARLVRVSPDGVEIPAEQHAAGQLVPALGTGFGAAGELVADAVQLTTMLPATLAMALGGDLTWRKASALASATGGLNAEQAGRVEDLVLPKARERAVGAHDAAVRRAVDRVDPDGIEDRKKHQREDIRLLRHHYGNGMGQLFADMPSEQLDRVWLATDTWARRRKNDGDPRTLQHLRVQALVSWADSFLSHGHPHTCDRDHHHPPVRTDSDPTDEADGGERDDTEPDETVAAPVASSPSLPRRHGRSVVQTVVWDLTSLLGLSTHCGLLLESNTVIAASTVAGLIAGGVRVRRGIIDGHGHLVDLSPRAWFLPPADGSTHRSPVELLLTSTGRLDELPLTVQWALQDLDSTDPPLAALLRELLELPVTADQLDAHPDDEKPSARLAAFLSLRAGHPINPGAGPSPANAADNDHHLARSDGGQTVRANLGPLTRRWHRLKTFDDWTVEQTPHGWHWTSPTGRHYLIEPFDYRLGP